jgi:hypothetical protein
MQGKIEIRYSNGNDIYLDLYLTNEQDKRITLLLYHIRFCLNYIEIGNITGFFQRIGLEKHETKKILTEKLNISPHILDQIEIEKERLGGVHTGGTDIELLYVYDGDTLNSANIHHDHISLEYYKLLMSEWMSMSSKMIKYEDVIKKIIISTKLQLTAIHKDILYYAYKNGYNSRNVHFNSDLIFSDEKIKQKYNEKNIKDALRYLDEFGYLINYRETTAISCEYYISNEKFLEIKKLLMTRRFKDWFFRNLIKIAPAIIIPLIIAKLSNII